LISLSNVNDQAITFHFNLEGLDVPCRRSVDLFAVVGVGGFADATALDCAISGNRIKPPVADVSASVVKGMKFSVIAADYLHAYGQSAAFQSQSSAWLFKLRCPVQVDCDLAVAETPALRVERLLGRRQAEYALDEAAIQEFDCHEASKEPSSKAAIWKKD
jgi:hypothetical protein